jgi:hypothetical protein
MALLRVRQPLRLGAPARLKRTLPARRVEAKAGGGQRRATEGSARQDGLRPGPRAARSTRRDDRGYPTRALFRGLHSPAQGACDKSEKMKLPHAAALALVGWYLMLALPVRAASGCDHAGGAQDPVECDGIAVPGTLWYLMSMPLAPLTSGMSRGDPDAPLSRWTIDGTYPTKEECDAYRLWLFWEQTNRRQYIPPDTPGLRCLSTDDLARAKAVHAPGWLLMLAPHDEATAPLAQWTTIKEPRDPGEPVYNVNFPSEKSCNDYRACLYGGCFGPGTVIQQPSIFDWWSEMRERQRQHRKFLASRCVPDDDPRLKEAMKLGHATALGLVGWYLIIPPRVSDWPVLVYDTNAPLSKWQQVGSFNYTAEQCDRNKKETAGFTLQTTEKMAGTGEDKQKAKQSIRAMLSGLRCIASDDRRLKEK